MATERTVAVFGAGAVGCHLGGRLARATIDPRLHVTLIGRPRVIDAIRAEGVILDEHGERRAVRVDVADSTAGLPPQDLVLLTVRTFDVERSIPDLKALLGDRGLLLAFQNGVGTEEALAQEFGRDRVLAATSTVSVGMEAPGVVTRYSRGGGVALASMDGSTVPTWIVDAFAATDVPTVTVDDYRALRWSKLLLNMLGASTTAILDMDIGDVMANPDIFRLEQLAFREAVRVMDAQSIRTVQLPGYSVPVVRRLMRLPRPLAQRILGRKTARSRGGRSPSMRSDMVRGKTEVATFAGAVVEAGMRLGIATPANSVLADLTIQLAKRPHRQDGFRRRPNVLVQYAKQQRVRL